MEICKQQSTIGKWRYASSKAKKGNGDMQAAKLEICQQQSEMTGDFNIGLQIFNEQFDLNNS